LAITPKQRSLSVTIPISFLLVPSIIGSTPTFSCPMILAAVSEVILGVQTLGFGVITSLQFMVPPSSYVSPEVSLPTITLELRCASMCAEAFVRAIGRWLTVSAAFSQKRVNLCAAIGAPFFRAMHKPVEYAGRDTRGIRTLKRRLEW
jgi:hypothetical protein